MATHHIPGFDRIVKCFSRSVIYGHEASAARLDAELARLQDDTESAAILELRAASLQDQHEAWREELRTPPSDLNP